MKQYQGLEFDKLKEEDIEELTKIMERAFDEDARIHLNEPKGGPEGYDNGEFLRKWGFYPGTEAYKISEGGKPIGGVILWIDRTTNVNSLGNIFLDVNRQNSGTGKLVWDFIEQEYPDTVKWCTETAAFSRRNHHFYVNKCGFHVVRIEKPMDFREGSYILVKDMK